MFEESESGLKSLFGTQRLEMLKVVHDTFYGVLSSKSNFWTTLGKCWQIDVLRLHEETCIKC